MVGFFKHLQAAFQSVLAEVPEGLRVILEFVWKARWFLVGGLLIVGVYNVVMTALPYLMWTYIIKMVLGGILPFLSL